jgi:starvation-inducible DNA-binding protein
MSRDIFFGRKGAQVSIQPNIGLDANARQSVVETLNLLLIDEAVLSFKTRRADGYAGGEDAPDLRALYDLQYEQIKAISNEIVERVKILGGSPLSVSVDLFDTARLVGELNTVPGIVNILADHEAFIRFLREDARRCSEMYEDQGTFALLVSVLRIHEKIAWSLRSNITSVQFDNEK